MTAPTVEADAAPMPQPSPDAKRDEEAKSEPRDEEARSEAEDKELLCTICGLRACWQK